MKLRGWVTVYDFADGSGDKGVWFSNQPATKPDGARVFAFELDVPDLHPPCEGRIIEQDTQEPPK